MNSLLQNRTLNPIGRLLVLPTIAEPRLHKQAQCAWHVGILTLRIQSQAGLLVTVLQQLPAWSLWHHESQSSGWEFPVWSQLKFSMSYSQSRHTQCLWDLSSSGTQPTDVVIAFMVYGALGAFQLHKQIARPWHWGFHSVILQPLGLSFPTHVWYIFWI